MNRPGGAARRHRREAERSPGGDAEASAIRRTPNTGGHRSRSGAAFLSLAAENRYPAPPSGYDLAACDTHGVASAPWKRGRVADLAVAHAAFEAALAKYPEKRLFLRERARVIRRYDEPQG